MPVNVTPDLTLLFNRIQDSAGLTTSDTYILATAFAALTEMNLETRIYRFGTSLEDALKSYLPE